MWSKALDAGLQVDAVFLDFARAFDRVHHKILLHKLCNFGISGVSFLSGQTTDTECVSFSTFNLIR